MSILRLNFQVLNIPSQRRLGVPIASLGIKVNNSSVTVVNSYTVMPVCIDSKWEQNLPLRLFT